MELVINVDYGAFGLSEKAKVYIASKAPEFVDGFQLKTSSIPRHHPVLVDAVKKLGNEANSSYASLEIIEVPDGIEYGIGSHDGMEYVYELGHIWGPTEG